MTWRFQLNFVFLKPIDRRIKNINFLFNVHILSFSLAFSHEVEKFHKNSNGTHTTCMADKNFIRVSEIKSIRICEKVASVSENFNY